MASAAAAGATTIDLTTVYTPISKTTSAARSSNTKLLKLPPPVPPTPLATHSKTQLQHEALKSSNDDLNLIVAPSKSYVSQPTTLPPKLLKRSGQTAELKQKKPLKDLRNRTTEVERASKLQAEVVIFFGFGQVIMG